MQPISDKWPFAKHASARWPGHTGRSGATSLLAAFVVVWHQLPPSAMHASLQVVASSCRSEAATLAPPPGAVPLEGQEDRSDAGLVCCVDHVGALSLWHRVQQHTHHLSTCCARCHVHGSPATGTWRRTCSVWHMCAPPTELGEAAREQRAGLWLLWLC